MTTIFLTIIQISLTKKKIKINQIMNKRMRYFLGVDLIKWSNLMRINHKRQCLWLRNYSGRKCFFLLPLHRAAGEIIKPRLLLLFKTCNILKRPEQTITIPNLRDRIVTNSLWWGNNGRERTVFTWRTFLSITTRWISWWHFLRMKVR